MPSTQRQRPIPGLTTAGSTPAPGAKRVRRARATTRGAMLLACVLTSALLAACGESEQQKAEKEVCSAKTEISTGIEALAGQTLETASISQIKADAQKVTSGLKQIAQAQSKLGKEQRAQLEQATSVLSAELREIAGSLVNLSGSEAKSKLSSATQKLLNSYKQTLAPVKC